VDAGTVPPQIIGSFATGAAPSDYSYTGRLNFDAVYPGGNASGNNVAMQRLAYDETLQRGVLLQLPNDW
jgi:hypothetical protein